MGKRHGKYGAIVINRIGYDVKYNSESDLKHDSSKHRVRLTFDDCCASRLRRAFGHSGPGISKHDSESFWFWYDKNPEMLQRFFDQLLLVSKKHTLTHPDNYSKTSEEELQLKKRKTEKEVWETALQNIIDCIQTYS